MPIRNLKASNADVINPGDYLLNPSKLGGLKQVTDVHGVQVYYGDYVLKEDPDSPGKHTPKVTDSIGYSLVEDVYANDALKVGGKREFRLWCSHGLLISFDFYVTSKLTLHAAGKSVADARKSAVYALGYQLLGATYRDRPAELTKAGQQKIVEVTGAREFRNNLMTAHLSNKYLTE